MPLKDMSQVHFVLGIFIELGFFVVYIAYVSGNWSLDQPWYGQFVVVVSVLFPIHTLIFNVERYFLSKKIFLNIAIWLSLRFIYIDYIHLHSYQEEFVKKMVFKLILLTVRAMVSMPGGEFCSKSKTKTGIFY